MGGLTDRAAAVRVTRHHRKKFKLAVAAEADKEPEVKSKEPAAKKMPSGARSMQGLPEDPMNAPAPPQQPPPPPPPPQQQPPAAAAAAGVAEGQAAAQQLAEAGLEHYKAGRLGDAVEHYQAAADQENELGNPVNPQLYGSKPPTA